ncbi:MAG: ParB/RepB/Spo0J family partition protein [Planctomycetaceae bacterium]|nr:ParB/RepB/Spo0J family partition protein [Planctomycetaceae bacterium]
MNDPFRIFPPATAEERANLKLSIEAVGVQSPVVMDEAGHVIDGHERRDVCIELGIDWLAGADVRVGLSEIERKALAIELNLWRRPIQLTQRQRNVLLDVYLIAKPHLSEHQVAELFCVNQSTVNRRKRALMLSHKLEPVTATIGKDGVSRKIGNRRKSGRVIVKNKREYDSLVASATSSSGEVRNGSQLNRPKKCSSPDSRTRLRSTGPTNLPIRSFIFLRKGQRSSTQKQRPALASIMPSSGAIWSERLSNTAEPCGGSRLPVRRNCSTSIPKPFGQ